MKTKIVKTLDFIFGRALCLLLGCLTLFSNKKNKIAHTASINKILIIRPGGLGDFLYLLSTIELLKKEFPAAQIDLLAEKRNSAAGSLIKIPGKIMLYDRQPFQALRTILFNNYDVVLDSEQFHYFSAVLAFLSRAGLRVGFDSVPVRNKLYTHLINYSLTGKEWQEFAKLLGPLGISEEEVKLQGMKSEEKTIMAGLSGKIVIVAPKGGDRYRAWGGEKYATAINYLLNDKERTVVIVGGASEKILADEIIKSVAGEKKRVVSLINKTTLPELYKLLRQGELFVGGDSGVAALANLAGIKSVLLFGPTDERKWGPEGPGHVIVRKKLPCTPCYRLGKYKPCREINCLKEITPQELIEAIKRVEKN